MADGVKSRLFKMATELEEQNQVLPLLDNQYIATPSYGIYNGSLSLEGLVILKIKHTSEQDNPPKA